jgi:endonuclease YncB( thermonuclease family)
VLRQGIASATPDAARNGAAVLVVSEAEAADGGGPRRWIADRFVVSRHGPSFAVHRTFHHHTSIEAQTGGPHDEISGKRSRFGAAGISPAMAAIILIDGDTNDVDGTRIRIVQIDAPETFRPRCENELVLGLTAKERLRALLDSCPVTFKPTGTDRYGRTLAYVMLAGLM